MAPYDSDSSDEDGDYSKTNVLLGYASTDPTDDDISHIGGYPTWLDAKNPPPATLAKCKQYFPRDERRLHIFCCRKRTCSKKIGSVRAFREVKKGEVKENTQKQPPPPRPQQPQPALGNALFGGSAAPPSTTGTNPFSMSGASQPPVNPFSSIGSPSTLAAKPPQPPVNDPEPPTETFADKLKISGDSKPPQTSKDPVEPWPDNSELASPFPAFHLDAWPEELEKEQEVVPAAEASKTQYDLDDNTNGGAAEKDAFESSMDKTFQKFSDRISQNPEQVLRYEYKGEPLLYSGADNVSSRFVVPHGRSGAVRGMPRCESCGAQRVFELQLVPGLIYELEKDEAMDLDDGMEWGTVLVGTCVNNCGTPGEITFREEWVGVQWEERVVKK